MLDDAFDRAVLAACVTAFNDHEQIASVLDDPTLKPAKRNLNRAHLFGVIT